MRQNSRIIQNFEAAVDAFRQSQGLAGPIAAAADAISQCFQRGAQVLVCGNGGSAAEAMHFAAELVGRFKPVRRRALPVLALTADSVFLTAWANDVSYDDVFARQVEAFGRRGDLLVGISTSGRSKNVIEAMSSAGQRGMQRVAILGGDGGEMSSLAEIPIVVPSTVTTRIQEVHLFIFHMICELVEEQVAERSS